MSSREKKNLEMVVFTTLVLGSLGASVWVATNSIAMSAAIVAGSIFLLWILQTIGGSDTM